MVKADVGAHDPVRPRSWAGGARWFVRIASLTPVVFIACAEIIGADFDVVPLGSEGGGGGRANVIEIAADDFAWDIVVDDTHVYWTCAGEDATVSAVRRAPKNGGAVETLTEGGAPNRLAQTDTHLYWTDSVSVGGRVQRWPKSGGAVEAVVEDAVFPFGLAIAGEWLFFASNELMGADSTLHRVDIGSGASFPAVPESYAAVPYGTTLIAAGPTLLWGSSTSSGQAFFVPLDPGTAPLPLQSSTIDVDAANGIVPFGDGEAYVGQLLVADAGIFRLGADGSILAQRLAGEMDLGDLAIDAGFVYYAAYGSGTLGRTPLAVGAPEALATRQTGVNGVALDGGRVYFTRYASKADGGGVAYMEKP